MSATTPEWKESKVAESTYWELDVENTNFRTRVRLCRSRAQTWACEVDIAGMKRSAGIFWDTIPVEVMKREAIARAISQSKSLAAFLQSSVVSLESMCDQ